MKSPLVSFVRALQRVEPDLSVDDTTDILWLALQMNKSTAGQRTPPAPRPARPAAPLPPANLESDAHLSPQQDDTASAQDPVPRRPAEPSLPRELGQAALYQSGGSTKGAVAGLPLRTPAAPALPGKRELLRALRPLVRRVPSARQQQLHLADTVQRIASEGLWLACLRPELERWFEVVVLIEHSVSMGMWQKLGSELYRMLESAGAFSAVRGYRVVTQEQPALYPLHARLDAQPRALSPLQLRAPHGRTLFLVVTDCVADAWSDGRMARLLAGLASAGPVALLQVFPGYMLDRTALAEATPLWLHACVPGAANAELQAAPQDGFMQLPADKSRYLKLPVMTLEPQSLASWARMLTATAGVWVSGWALARPSRCRALAAEDLAAEPASEAATEQVFPTVSAAARVSAFRLSASPLARQLARLLTVFRGSGFSLPILRLVRQVLLPQARQHHDAEVLLSSLVEALPDSAGPLRRDPEQVQYDFISGVPELLDAMPSVLQQAPTPSKQTVLESLTLHVAQQLGSPRDFMAVVSALSGLAHGQTEFARLSLALLRRLGDRYAALATAGSASLIEWSAAGHRRRNRVELAAYLGDPLARSLLQLPPSAPEMPLVQWLLGLRQWGTLVLADATLAVAEHLAARAVWLGHDLLIRMSALLQAARGCIAEPSHSRAVALRKLAIHVNAEGLGSDQEKLALRACVDATLAAVAPWHPEQPHGERLMELARASVVSTEYVLGDTAELCASVGEHLQRQLRDPHSYIPACWRSNGCQILIAGDLARNSEPTNYTAATLGYLLAAAGYDLLYKGLAGVERLALRAYLGERESSGSPSAHLRLPPLVEGPHYAQDLLVSLYSTRAESDGQLSPGAPAVTLVLGETDYVGWLVKDRLRKNLPVLPLPWTGSEAQKRFKKLWDLRDRYWAFDGRQLGYIDGWWTPDATVQAQTERVLHVFNISLSAKELSQYRQFALNMLRLLVLATSKVESLLASPRWHSYLASLAGAAYRDEVPLQHLSPAEYSRPRPTEAELLREHLSQQRVEYARGVPIEQTRTTILAALAALLPAMREWLAFDFANIAELINLDSTVSSMLVVWLVPLVVEHAWPLARSALLATQFRTPTDSRWLATLLGVVRRAHQEDARYQDEIVEVAVTWAKMYLQVVVPEQGDARLALLRNWLKQSGLVVDAALMESLARDDAPENRIIGYLLMQIQDLLVPESLAEECLRCEQKFLESTGETRPLAILIALLSGLARQQPQLYGHFSGRFERLYETLKQYKVKDLKVPSRPDWPHNQPVAQSSSPDQAKEPKEEVAPQAEAAGLPPHFRTSAKDGDTIPDGYFAVCIDGVYEQDRVFFQVSSFAEVRDFFDTLWVWYLSFRYEAFTYGSDWLLVNAESAEILVPWNWLCEPSKHNYELDRKWMRTIALPEVGLLSGATWRVMRSDVPAYGVAVNEKVYHLVAVQNKKQLGTLAAKEILTEATPSTSDEEEYNYTTVFYLAEPAVLGISNHRVWKQRITDASPQPKT